MLVTLNNAGVSRSNRWLVRGISMTVEPGEIVTLIGPNGSGKSTTAKMALGVLKACLLYTSPSPRDVEESRMPSSA